MLKINHRDRELNIGGVCDCDDYLKLKIAGWFPLYNNITVAARRGEDKFFLAPRDPKTDISDAVAIPGRYLFIGDLNTIDTRIFNSCVLQNQADNWLEINDSLYMSRLLIAGAIRVLISCNDLDLPITRTAEYIQAKIDGRVIIF